MKWIVLIEPCGKGVHRDEIEIALADIGHAVGGVKRGDDARLAGVEILIFSSLLFDEDQDFVGTLPWQSAVTDGLNFGAAEALGREALAKLVHVGGLGKADIHV